jgi:fumarate hydratase subunit alpha
MKEIAATDITAAVAAALVSACVDLPADVEDAMRKLRAQEPDELAQDTLDTILRNADIAREKKLPLCQDTGVTTVIVELGADVHVSGGFLPDAINDGIRLGSRTGHLRNSIVRDPLQRTNTNDNAPGTIYVFPVPGDELHISIAPKGAGCENMSRSAMLRPGDGPEAITAFVVAAVKQAKGNPCPPLVIGVGIGGDFAWCAVLAKKALLRPIGGRHPEPYYATLERELLDALNATGVGPMGFGGRSTAIDVFVEKAPCHIASLPVAVCINCHAARHRTIVM